MPYCRPWRLPPLSRPRGPGVRSAFGSISARRRAVRSVVTTTRTEAQVRRCSPILFIVTRQGFSGRVRGVSESHFWSGHDGEAVRGHAGQPSCASGLVSTVSISASRSSCQKVQNQNRAGERLRVPVGSVHEQPLPKHHSLHLSLWVLSLWLPSSPPSLFSMMLFAPTARQDSWALLGKMYVDP